MKLYRYRAHATRRTRRIAFAMLATAALFVAGAQTADAAHENTRKPRAHNAPVCVEKSCNLKHHGRGSVFRHTDSRARSRSDHAHYDRRDRHDNRYSNAAYWAGYRRGAKLGYDDGYSDGRYGRSFCGVVPRVPRCSAAERRGFIAGYQSAYRDGYDRGRYARYDSCRPRRPHYRH